ncbi:2-dehydro-3-deoxygalactonokinase [Lewinella marina]|uniref:2-keto-3-deoxy-galactonokinase n=1 Tax=Neolewinella marina TaxID=438751 RepID=A0A2G0CDM7_9BACT|nr:2-dehydro-3-deoxygalactonokinase [Neolewinella marina]NJB85957.1 2-dehydro-3-deoxygalactonokinase [Neolewinella marina]PHK98072.1 2-keto-3-deoxy-galactonokinase [Neolewinella marina]
MKLPTHFISCDWGTTNFRLRLVTTDNLEILAEQTVGEGVKALFLARPDSSSAERERYLATYLAERIRALPGAAEHPVVISGMASSNIGLRELPYATLPLTLDHPDLEWEALTLPDNRPAVLISGVRDALDVMRGEETQALGLAGGLAGYDRGVLLLPGTHSKHLQYETGAFTAFTTYLTGELFALLTEHSLLRQAICKPPGGAFRAEAFQEGVRAAVDQGLTARLFTVRARQLLSHSDPTDNFFFLSGLLIGDELRSLHRPGSQVFLAAGEPFLTLYRLALEEIVGLACIHCFSEPALDAALLAGQRTMLAAYVNG